MIYLQGVTFAEQNVAPTDDARLYRAAASDGILSGCSISSVGATLVLGAGSLLVAGRNIRVPSSQSFAVNNATSGYARLLLTIDLTQTATEAVFNQVSADIEYSSTMDGFASLVQDDINTAGSTYQLALAVMSLSAAGISSIVRQLGAAHARGLGVQVALSSSGWVNNLQTVPVIGATASGNVIVTAAEASKDLWDGSGIRCTAQADGTLTFSCDGAPGSDVTANVLFL